MLNRPLALLFTLALSIAGCSVNTVAPYDAVTDKNVTALHRKVETFLIQLAFKNGQATCSYANNTSFYLDSKVDLSAITIRAKAFTNNELTIQQLAALKQALASLEMLHQLKDKKTKKSNKLHCLTALELTPIRSAFETSFAAILKLEMAKTRLY